MTEEVEEFDMVALVADPPYIIVAEWVRGRAAPTLAELHKPLAAARSAFARLEQAEGRENMDGVSLLAVDATTGERHRFAMMDSRAPAWDTQGLVRN